MFLKVKKVCVSSVTDFTIAWIFECWIRVNTNYLILTLHFVKKTFIALFYLLTFLFLTSSPCRWLSWRKEPLELTALTGLTARTGLLDGLERTLTSSITPSLNRLPLLTLLLLMEKDLYRLSSSEDICRSVCDLALIDISKKKRKKQNDWCSFAKMSLSPKENKGSRFVVRT